MSHTVDKAFPPTDTGDPPPRVGRIIGSDCAIHLLNHVVACQPGTITIKAGFTHNLVHADNHGVISTPTHSDAPPRGHRPSVIGEVSLIRSTPPSYCRRGWRGSHIVILGLRCRFRPQENSG